MRSWRSRSFSAPTLVVRSVRDGYAADGVSALLTHPRASSYTPALLFFPWRVTHQPSKITNSEHERVFVQDAPLPPAHTSQFAETGLPATSGETLWIPLFSRPWFLELGESICASHVELALFQAQAPQILERCERSVDVTHVSADGAITDGQRCQIGEYTERREFYGQPPAQVLDNPPHSIEIQNTFLVISLTIVQVCIALSSLLFCGDYSISKQIFFANRIRSLSGNWTILLLTLVVSLFSLIVGLISEAQLWTSTAAVITLEAKMRWVRIAGMAATPILDIIIASSLCFCLWRRRESEFRRLCAIMQVVLVLTSFLRAQTCRTSPFKISNLNVRLVSDRSGSGFRTNGRSLVFANSMLAVLNGRRRFHSHEDEEALPTLNALAFDSSGREVDNATTNSTLFQLAAFGHDLTASSSTSATPVELEPNILKQEISCRQLCNTYCAARGTVGGATVLVAVLHHA
ncbi:hypothetical protein B0H12DRAFT_1067962 [Mycena haematopus]|nr:hypothetical protein B0H12DRAFT_1067962 [Mycena haematopus]